MKLIIFAGGAGTRLWPLSRKNSPKQFGRLIGDKSTIQQTIDRLLPSFAPSDIFIATGKQYSEIVFEQLSKIPRDNFIFEPAMRDVGPALGLTAAILEKRFGSDEPVAILWSDHMVKQEALFRKMITKAGDKIRSKDADFIFIGQKPRFANQNMGWIEVGEKLQDQDSIHIYEFSKLRYRPNPQEAEQFFRNKNYVWNLGYFVTSPHFLTSLFREHAHDMFEQLQLIADAYGTDDYDERLERIYPTVEKISFDDAVLTKLANNNILVFSADLGWSDIGAWESLKEALTDSEHQNVIKGDALVEDCRDSIIFNEGKQLVVGIDLDGYVAINTDDVILICPKNAVPKIKKVVEKLAGTKREHLT
ncbi:MAG: mannose-1-phosphate guanylyltransferase [Candidatus Levybacteria bacterium]|nr:mannose-1-phosphate guanylyltransferase [Candidatus Levybacteria bacterium]